MKFRHNETGQIFNGEFEFRMAYSNVSFPPTLDQNALDFANVSRVVEVPEPSCTPLQRVDFDGIQLIDGQWTEVWSIHNKYDDPAEQAAWVEEYIQSEWNCVREERKRLLRESDYTDLPNTPITAQCRNNFLTYRQALRDVTTQSDPFNIVWPEIPTYEPQT
jgi:hypothetical protein